MTSDDPGDDIFGHLDDPTPPMHGGEALTQIVQRGLQIRPRRRAGYLLSTAAVVVAVAGTAFAVAGSDGPNRTGTQIANSTSPSPSGSHHPKKTKHPQHPGGTPSSISSIPGGGTLPGHHHHHHPRHGGGGGGGPVPPGV